MWHFPTFCARANAELHAGSPLNRLVGRGNPATSKLFPPTLRVASSRSAQTPTTNGQRADDAGSAAQIGVSVAVAHSSPMEASPCLRFAPIAGSAGALHLRALQSVSSLPLRVEPPILDWRLRGKDVHGHPMRSGGGEAPPRDRRRTALGHTGQGRRGVGRGQRSSQMRLPPDVGPSPVRRCHTNQPRHRQRLGRGRTCDAVRGSHSQGGVSGRSI
jgi:hypothetical protein